MVKHIETKAEFDALKAENADKLIVVDFYADWCGPCKRIVPDYVKLAEEFADVVFVKVNVDNNTEVSESENISAMPTFRGYKNGKQVDEVVGADMAKVKDMVIKHK